MRSTRWLLASLLVSAIASCGGNGNGDDTPKPQCSDGIDNDGDGMTDFPEDLGCHDATDDSEDSLTEAQCSDGRDNDGDGLTDYPADPGCFAPQQDDEKDDCPDGPMCPQCADHIDNDGNGVMDYPNDPGCTSASDDDEQLHNPVACGTGMTIHPLPTTNNVMGMLDTTSTSMLTSPCGGGGGLPAVGYELHLSKPKVVIVSTVDSLTTADTIIDIRSSDCSASASEIACNDNVDSMNTQSKVTASLVAGNYYIIVSAKTGGSTGPFTLDVKTFAGEGTTCVSEGDCGPGLVCRIPLGASAKVCAKPMCSDGVDDDGDGKLDYPTDPGCTAPDDNDETDTCPNGVGCPECGDGRDNDLDGKTDYPMDTTCLSAGDSSESCVTTDGVSLLTMPMTTGDTSTAHDDVHPTCASTTTHAAPDRTYRLDVPALTTLNLNLVSTTFDSVTALYNSTCGGTALSCSDPYNMVVSNLAAGTYYFVVDGWGGATNSGPYTIAVSGTIQGNQSCESPLAVSGALICTAGFACKGTAGSRTCQPALCNDGIDNDGDGKKDYPFDPGCTDPADDTEQDTCPGAGCPVCSDGLDNDTDTKTDYPLDYGCSSAAGTTEVFCMPETDPTSLAVSTPVTGTTAGLMNSTVPTCRSTSTAPDTTVALSLPVPVASLVIDTIGSAFDTVLDVRDATCATELACDDDGGGSLTSKVTMTNISAGNYAIVVDGYTTNAGAYTLNIKGTVAPQTACTSALFTGGTAAILACPAGTTCTGGKCQ